MYHLCIKYVKWYSNGIFELSPKLYSTNRHGICFLMIEYIAEKVLSII